MSPETSHTKAIAGPHCHIIGVDEAGRGPLAGSVVAAAVILPEQYDLPFLTDSKKLTAKKRQTLETQIKTLAIDWCVAEATAAEIDQHNILQATLLAMTRAIHGLSTHHLANAALIRIDGNRLPANLPTKAEAIIDGDRLHAEISAASILAKEARDRQLIALDAEYPTYGFAQHKGYPTKAHMQALASHGPCPAHRQSFAPVARAIASRA